MMAHQAIVGDAEGREESKWTTTKTYCLQKVSGPKRYTENQSHGRPPNRSTRTVHSELRLWLLGAARALLLVVFAPHPFRHQFIDQSRLDYKILHPG